MPMHIASLPGSAPRPPVSRADVATPPVGCTAHQFEGRYDEISIGAVSKKVYVQDVCVTCGAVAARQSKPSEG